MIRGNDPWLQKKDNIDKLLLALLENRESHHGNISLDNILINEKTDGVTLINADPFNYNLTQNHGATNFVLQNESDYFREIGLIIQSLRKGVPSFPKRHYKKFERLSFKPGVHEGELYSALLSSGNKWGWIVGITVFTAAIIAIFWIFIRYNTDSGDRAQTAAILTGDTVKAKKSIGSEIDLQQLEDSLNAMESSRLITEYSGDGAARINHVSPAKDTKQVEIENIIEMCYSNLAPLFASSEYILDDPLPEEEAEILENIELIEWYLVSDKEKAIEKISALHPGMNAAEILTMVENSDPYQKFTIQSSKMLKDLKKAGARLAAERYRP